ncbi:MAG: phytoene desaturase [Saprospiraceae bacterium]|nr:phytoene desaturase [Saprospiraceae bacterium]MBK8546493.1 phytoene desaturase [Saprospiraceae bacterium]MBK8817614.1 phytoene desaturase [Saprospiraceae bacterium]
MTKTSNKCIVIGAGIAGIAAAIRVRLLGYEVDVYEKNNFAGGKLTSFSKDGFHFDAGPSLFTEPENVLELFDLAGEKPNDYFTFSEVPVSCHYFYSDGTNLKAYTDLSLFADEIETKLGENRKHLLSYAKDAAESYENIGHLFLDYSLHDLSLFPFKKVGKALQKTKWSYLFSTLHDYNKNRFSNPKTVQLFDRFATYNGSNPFKAPGMLSMIPHLELGKGTFYPHNGMISITRALTLLAKKTGVQFYFESLVQKIKVEANKAEGIMVNNTFKKADIVISNMDVYYVYDKLLGHQSKAKEILKQERSSSAFIFYWGIKKIFKELGLHNIFFSDDYRKEFSSIFNDKKICEDPTVYINITSKMDPSHASEGMENWFVMVNTFHHTNEDWAVLKKTIKTKVLHKLSSILKTDIASLIVSEETLDPLVIQERTLSHTGSLYGTSSNSAMAAFLRHPNFSKEIKNLYFTGGSVHPGGGIPLCLRSAKIVGSLIEKYQYAR